MPKKKQNQNTIDVISPEVKAMQAMYEQEINEQRQLIAEQTQTIQKLEGKIIVNTSCMKEKEEKLKKFVSKDAKTEIIAEFLKGLDFTDNQIRKMSGTERIRWTTDEFAEAAYLFEL